MEQNRKPRNKPTIIWSINFKTGGKNMQWEKDSLFDNGVGKTGQLQAKE